MKATQSEALLAHHNRRIKNVKTQLDDKPPQVYSSNILALSKYREDCSNYAELVKRNMQLLIKITGIMRTFGTLNTFNSTPYLNLSRIAVRRRRICEIEQQNYAFGIRLNKVHGDLKLMPCAPYKRPKSNRKFKLKVKAKPPIFIYPELVMEKYNNCVPIPESLALAKKLFRPVIFFDLEIFNERPLGRILIDLYTEAAPHVVMEFVHMCIDNEPGRITFSRIFPKLWMEGEFVIFNEEPDANKSDVADLCDMRKMEYDMRALDNGSGTGIFSFPLHVYKTGIINFSISFKPLGVINGERVAFARISKGYDIVECLQDLGTFNGKPVKSVAVSNCGLLK